MIDADSANLERLVKAKAKLAEFVTEMIVRLRESEGLQWAQLLDPSLRAAQLAATLGFPCPPVEFAIIQSGSAPDPILDTNPAYTHAIRLRIRDPGGMSYLDRLLGVKQRRNVPGAPLDPSLVQTGSTDRDKVIRALRQWDRAVSRVDVRNVRHARDHIRGPVESFQRYFYVGELAREVRDWNLLRYVDPRLDPAESQKWTEAESEQAVAMYHELQREFDAEFEVVPLASGVDDPLAPTDSTAAKRGARGMLRADANRKARELLDADPSFRDRTLRQWAEAIGCSPGLVNELPVWKAVMDETGRSRKDNTSAGRSRTPQAASLTDKVEATVGRLDDPSENVENDSLIRKLIEAAKPKERAKLHRLEPEQLVKLAKSYAEQCADAEPSTLEADPCDAPRRRVRTRKRL